MLAAAFASVALLPGLLTGTVADVKQDTPVPILLPSRIHTDIDPLYGSGGGSRKDYQISVSSRPHCGANACSLAVFSGFKGGKLYGGRKATLARGRHGRYNTLSCGGSCSPPSVTWVERGVLYEIQMDFPSQTNARRELIKMANSAITHGPR